AGHGVMRFRLLGLFLDVDDAAVGNLGHAEALGIGDFLEEDFSAALLPAELLDGLADAFLYDVVAQDHAGFLAFREILGQLQRVGDAALAFLIAIADNGKSELAP